MTKPLPCTENWVSPRGESGNFLPSRMVVEARGCGITLSVNPVRKMRVSGGKTNVAWARQRLLEEVTFEKYKHTRQGRGSKVLVEKHLAARPGGCTEQGMANRLVWLRGRCRGQQRGQAGSHVKGLECHAQKCRLRLKQLRGFPFCYCLPLPLFSSVFFSLSL